MNGADRRQGESVAPVDDRVAAVVRQILAVLPAGCSWVLPVRERDGLVVDFRIAATSGQAHDIHGRGVSRIGARLTELYPSMVGGPLWTLYLEVIASGVPGVLPEFRYEEKRAGVVASSVFEISVHRVLDGLLVWWQRLDEDRRRMEKTELLGSLGWAEYDLTTGRSDWSPGMYRIFERDPALGPMPRAEQAAALHAEDRGVAEAAWQTLDSGVASDVTVRFRTGVTVKYLRILSDVLRDVDGAPLKINAVVQDVTANRESHSAIERLGHQLRSREMTALAEHRLAAQLQNMIQPLPREPFRLPGLEVMVGYLPAESAVRVGGDWYHAGTVADGKVVLAVGDVAGHGLAAAGGMAHLRYALVAWLSIGILDAGTLLAHMNRLCGQLRITGTAVVGVYDPATTTLSWARAGHMAPLLARAGAVGPLDLPPGLLLGADDRATYPVEMVPLHRGDVLLLYTDGLVERRTVDAATMLGDVRTALAAASVQPAGHALTELGGVLTVPSPDDDTCTVAVRVLPVET